MPLLRGRRDDATKYRMSERLFAIGDDYWIENEDGERTFKVDGKALGSATRSSSRIPPGTGCSPSRRRSCTSATPWRSSGGRTVASVKKALITPLRERFSIEVDGGEDMEAKGNIVDHEYGVERDGDKVAEVSKRWFRVRDTYGIEISPGQDDALILVVVVCIDQMTRG